VRLLVGAEAPPKDSTEGNCVGRAEGVLVGGSTDGKESITVAVVRTDASACGGAKGMRSGVSLF
jgi:hypothetical protein